MKVAIKGAHLFDPKNKVDEVGNIFIDNGKVVDGSTKKPPEIEIDASNLYLIPGLIDIHSHLRTSRSFHHEVGRRERDPGLFDPIRAKSVPVWSRL